MKTKQLFLITLLSLLGIFQIVPNGGPDGGVCLKALG